MIDSTTAVDTESVHLVIADPVTHHSAGSVADPPIQTVSKTRITVSFLFVLFRVISRIACYALRKAIHEITRKNTNEVPRQIRVLTQSLPRGGSDSLTTAHRKPCQKTRS